MSSDALTCKDTLIENAQQGDGAAKEDLVRMHQPLIWAAARRVCCNWLSLEELVQAGNVGLLRALQRYQPSQGVKLATYAFPWILGEMKKAMKATEYSAYSMDEALEEENWTLHDVLVGCLAVDVERIDLSLAFSKLGCEGKRLLFLRYFLDKTQKESAQIMGKSQAQISRMERNALDALQSMLR